MSNSKRATLLTNVPIETWPGIDLSVLKKEDAESVENSIRALTIYAHGTPHSQIFKETGITRQEINRLLRRCTALSDDGQVVDPAKLPIELTRQVGELIKAKSSTLTIFREATEAEAEALEVAARRKLDRPQYVKDFEAEISGIEALYPENNIRDLLIVEVGDKLKAFKPLSIDEMTNHQLTYWKKWATSIETTLEKVERSVAFGRELLSKKNLAPLLRIEGLDKQDGLRRVKAFLDGL